MAWTWKALAFAIALVFAAACDDPPSSATGPSGVVSRITVLGDSLAVSPTPSQAFPAVLQARLDEANAGRTIVNASRSGDTTTDGLARIDALLAVRPGILILELGANDGLQGVPIATVRRNLREIIIRAREAGARVLLCGMETPPLHGLRYSLDFHEIYPSLADEQDVELVPFLLAGVIGNPSMNLADGIHPNAAGARRIADNVWAHLAPMLSEETTALRRN